MNLPIRVRLLFLMMVVPLLIVFALAYLSYAVGVTQFKQHLEDDLEVLASTVGESLVAPLQFQDSETAKKFLENVVSHHEVYRVCVCDATGAEFVSWGKAKAYDPLEEDLEKKEQVIWYEKGIARSKNIVFGGKVEGSIILYSNLDPLLKFQDTFAATLTGALIVMVILLSFLSFWVKKTVTDPLLSLNESTQVLAGGNLEHRIALSRTDEFGQLASSFNEMAMTLQASTSELKEAHDYTHDIVDSMQDAVFVCSSDWIIKSVNSYGCRLMHKDLTGHCLRDYLILPQGEEAEAVMEETHSNTEEGIREKTAFLKRENLEDVEVSYSAKLLSNKVDFVLVARDIREFRKAQQQIISSAKMASLGELVAGIAHELNNALNFVVGSLPQLERDFRVMQNGQADQKVFDKAQRKIDRLKEGSRRSTKIIQALKSFSHTQQAEMAFTQVNDLLRTTLDLIPSEYRQEVDFVEDLGDLPEVLCHGDELNQVFINIMVNAAQAIDGEGVVKVSSRVVESYVEVVITDNGSGIKEEVLESIFDPFFTTKDVGVGTGLGLSISHGIIERHGGTIRVESTRGKGTSFIIRLKVA